MSAVRIWVMAARVRTLPAAVAPVLVGTSLALGAGHFAPLAFLAALLGAVFIQVGTNLSNDYSDARRGADTEDRLGPVRVTAGGLVPPSQVLLATYVTFGLAVGCGAYLVAVAGPELLAVGAASILAGVLYTGGPRPYGYEGLGEVFVFLFFGIVAVTGSYFVQVQELPWQAFVCAVPVGLLASAILVVNNVRDLETDRRAGKRTLAVRLGDKRTRMLYTAMVAGAFATAPLPWALGSMTAWLLLSWAAIPLAAPIVRVVRTRTDGPALNGALARTGALQLVFCLLFAAGHSGQWRHRLVRLSVQPRALRLQRPLQSSYGTVTERELLAVSITDADGVTGYGEAAPLEPYDGVSVEQVERALESYAPVLADAEEMNGAQILDACRGVEDLPAALAAIDLALWDRAGRRAGQAGRRAAHGPSRAGGGRQRDPVGARPGAGLRAGSTGRAARVRLLEGEGRRRRRRGPRGRGARAAAGPEVALRLDANGAWNVEEAVRAIDALSPAGLELVEEPTHGLEGVRDVRERVAVRVAIDETAAEHGALGAGVADAVCLKISRCGGISGLIAAAALVRASGAEVYLASTLDGPLGVAAAVHAAAALASRGPVPACGLDTLGLFEDFDNPLPARTGKIALPFAAGLGVDPL